MLDRAKVMRELSVESQNLFVDYSIEHQAAYAEWQKICRDALFLQKVEAHPTYALPTWNGDLKQVHKVTRFSKPYQVVSVDGSQIYPDKHQGTSCFLLNIGTAVLRYGMGQGTTLFSSEPFLFVGQDNDDEASGRSVDVVNAKREEFELKLGFETCERLREEHASLPLLFLFDGSLIFWHLESKETFLKQYFVNVYCQTLLQFFEKKIPVAGYLSLPKNKDLVNLIRASATDFSASVTERNQLFPHTIDAMLALMHLEEGERTSFFASTALIVGEYPAQVRPWFCYYATSAELVRIELPEYVVACPDLAEQALTIIADQVFKGNGYPICTAEAHIQAVVKGADREFFYHAVERYGIQQRKRLIMSQKNLKKRRMSV